MDMVEGVLARCVESLGDPYRSKNPLPSVPNYQEPDLPATLSGTLKKPEAEKIVHSTPLHRVEWNKSMNSYNV